MSLTTHKAAVMARQLITEDEESTAGYSVPRIQAIVPVALDVWLRAVVQDKGKRELLKQEFTIDITDGEVDLSDYVDGTEAKIDLKELRRTPIYSDAARHANCCGDRLNHAYTWVNSMSQLANDRPLSGDAYACFLEGSRLYIKGGCDGMTAEDAIKFSTASYPTTVADIPAALEGDFIITLARLAAGGALANGNG